MWEVTVFCVCVCCDVSAHMACGRCLCGGSQREGEGGTLGHTLLPECVLQYQLRVHAAFTPFLYLRALETALGKDPKAVHFLWGTVPLPAAGSG